MRLRVGGFKVGKAALKVTSKKVTKYEKLCMENQHIVIQFNVILDSISIKSLIHLFMIKKKSL